MIRLMQLDNPKILALGAVGILFLINVGVIVLLLVHDGNSLPAGLDFLEKEALALMSTSGAATIFHSFFTRGNQQPPKTPGS